MQNVRASDADSFCDSCIVGTEKRLSSRQGKTRDRFVRSTRRHRHHDARHHGRVPRLIPEHVEPARTAAPPSHPRAGPLGTTSRPGWYQLRRRLRSLEPPLVRRRLRVRARWPSKTPTGTRAAQPGHGALKRCNARPGRLVVRKAAESSGPTQHRSAQSQQPAVAAGSLKTRHRQRPQRLPRPPSARGRLCPATRTQDQHRTAQRGAARRSAAHGRCDRGPALLPERGGGRRHAAGRRRRAHRVLHLALHHTRRALLGRCQAILAVLRLERHVRCCPATCLQRQGRITNRTLRVAG